MDKEVGVFSNGSSKGPGIVGGPPTSVKPKMIRRVDLMNGVAFVGVSLPNPPGANEGEMLTHLLPQTGLTPLILPPN